jgi:hypothetical protein
MLVGTQLSVAGAYRPPLAKNPSPSAPPQTIISLPVQTEVWWARSLSAPWMPVATQLSVAGV